jgi:hypothetical protein
MHRKPAVAGEASTFLWDTTGVNNNSTGFNIETWLAAIALQCS